MINLFFINKYTCLLFPMVALGGRGYVIPTWFRGRLAKVFPLMVLTGALSVSLSFFWGVKHSMLMPLPSFQVFLSVLYQT